MLLGYDRKGEIKFIFTDEKYLEKKYPNNTAKISNFWGTKNHGLIEFFIPINTFKEWDNAKNYKIVNGNLIEKDNKKIKEPIQSLIKEDISVVKDEEDNLGMKTSNIEIRSNKGNK